MSYQHRNWVKVTTSYPKQAKKTSVKRHFLELRCTDPRRVTMWVSYTRSLLPGARGCPPKLPPSFVRLRRRQVMTGCQKTSDKQDGSQVTARKMSRETMAEKKANEATWALVKSFQETNQAVVQSIIAAQERNTKFAQSFFSEGMEILKANQAVAEGIIAAQERNTKF